MGRKMKNAPVYFTVAQVQFNPVLKMEDYLPSIQERMRTIHFPDFRRETLQQLTLSFTTLSESGQQPAPSFVPQPRCIFGNIDGTTEFILENSSFAIQTTAYGTHESFFKMFLDGARILHETLKLDFMGRTGLRYFDAVLPKAGESLADYLTPEVLGLSNKLSNKLTHSFSETLTVSTNGQLASRILIRDGQIALPPEVKALAPPLNIKFSSFEGRHAIIDIDAFTYERKPFNLETLRSRLLHFHDEIENAFKAIVTTFALTSWQ